MAKTPPRRNAFERAQDAALAYQVSWWQLLEQAIAEGVIKAEISGAEFIRLGDDDSALGARLFERRTLTVAAGTPSEGAAAQSEWEITRPIPVLFSSLPIEALEVLAADILENSEAEWRQANIDHLIAEARSFDIAEARATAREVLGEDADDAAIDRFAEQLRLPSELVDGGAAAAAFFDEQVSSVRIDEGEDGELLFPETPTPPGAQPFDVGEWDYYTPEEVEDVGGPESDAAYAFRVLRLCEAIRGTPDAAVQLAMQLGAVTREWEIWRENEEFLRAGRTQFAEQGRRARSKPEKAWMRQVREDLAAGAIGSNVADYARKLERRRDLHPPSSDRIRNFISQIKREEPVDGSQ